MNKIPILITLIILGLILFVFYLIYLYKQQKKIDVKENNEQLSDYSEDLEMIKKSSLIAQQSASTNLESKAKKIEKFEKAFDFYEKRTQAFGVDEKELAKENSPKEKKKEDETKTAIPKAQTDKSELAKKIKEYKAALIQTCNFIKEERNK